MIAYDSRQALIGLHIPKTAGTSFRSVLEGWFPGETLLPHYRRHDDLPPSHALRAGICLYGHFNALRNFGVSDYYPEASQFFCFLREPFARFISLWRYLSPYGDVSDPIAFERWLNLRGEEQLRDDNPHSFLWYLPAPPRTKPTPAILGEAFIFVGLFERLQASVDGLAEALGRQSVAISHVNASHRVAGRFDSFRPRFERLFADEMEFYEIARAINLSMTRKPASFAATPR